MRDDHASLSEAPRGPELEELVFSELQQLFPRRNMEDVNNYLKGE